MFNKALLITTHKICIINNKSLKSDYNLNYNCIYYFIVYISCLF